MRKRSPSNHRDVLRLTFGRFDVVDLISSVFLFSKCSGGEAPFKAFHGNVKIVIDSSREGTLRMGHWKGELGKQRDTLSVIVEILETSKQVSSKTRIQNKTSLCTRQINEYLRFMIEAGLLQQNADGERKVYEATERGSHLLKRAYELEDLLRTDESTEKKVTRPPSELLRIMR